VADPRRLKQVLINLLNNAVKFTPNNGKVKLEVTTDAQSKRMHFAVSDTGIGICAEDMPRLFQPFVQLDSKLSRIYAGTGLGLVLVKKMVEMQGGSVEVQSEFGVGSCFTFALPWEQKDEKLQPESENEGRSAPTATHAKVLIADDDKGTVMIIEGYLGEYGFQVFVAEDGRQVIPKVEEIMPDVILMDIQMPYGNGLDLTRRLRADPRFATIPIIALTAFAMQEDEERCLAAGMNEYMSKPVKLKDLKKLIERLLSRSEK
jgi:CheY-like chemotaxis protein